MDHIITKYDIDKLIKFSNQLGTFNILLSRRSNKFRMLYKVICIVSIILFLFCVFDLYYLYKNEVSKTMLTLTFIIIIIDITLFSILLKNKYKMMSYVQQFRKFKLKNYFKDYSDFNLKIIVELLQKRIDKSKFDMWKMIIIIGTLIYPVWEYYINIWLDKSEINSILFGIIARAMIILFCIIILYIINIPINYVVCYKKRNIENIIFILKYIIHEREEYEKFINR